MVHRVYFTRSAQDDFQSIIDFIAADNPGRALSFVDDLQRRAVKLLADFPRTGRQYGSFHYLVFGNYILAYDIDDAARAVHILLVTEGHRLWQELLTERS
ncbi:type II toxin-antitoxin system RelE/ParE family toxin [Pseudaminobacter arsenicus]|uniref:Type II toxin-antitoxin system RelE/ParE family toxin n=1 Tax=Borborobacter arsenicus TaxID=1851146 RepID=A0A432VAB3_9HYPH|nr:type II toxin-antitoxin system RelE/ParE family toxin [Pseudaminobacter arsenicus]RUM99084.1 type II toxin-antitoxin system RelE/ParE family toxin [Pseudaminobacter arsenicus]